MKKILLASLLCQTLIMADSCDVLLSESLQVTDMCLGELERNDAIVKAASLYDAEKIASIMDSNEFLNIDIQELKTENGILQSKNKKLNALNLKLETELVVSKNKYSKLEDRMTVQTQRLGNVMKSLESSKAQGAKFLKLGGFEELANRSAEGQTQTKKSSLVTATKNKKTCLGVKNRDDLHLCSEELLERYKNATPEELIDNGIYKVSSYMQNVRHGHSSRYKISAVVKKNELVEIKDIYISEHENSRIIWIKTHVGWTYVSHGKQADHIALRAGYKKSDVYAKSKFTEGSEG